MKRKFTTLIELMVMIPIFTMGIYGAIYFGEVTMSRINGAVASRLVSASSDNISNDDLATMFTTERGKIHIANGGENFWATGSNVNIYMQDKAPTNWPVSEDGSPHNVIHEYFIEYGFDIINNYEINNGQLERTTSFRHPPGGLELMRWFLWAEADDVIEKVLQERITYSYSKVDFDYKNKNIMPGSYDEIAKGETGSVRDKISFSNEGRNLILKKNTVGRDFYQDMNTIDRLTGTDYDYMKGNQALSDIRMVSSARLQTGSGGTELDVGGGAQAISFTTDQVVFVRQKYPLEPKIELDFNSISEDQSIVIDEMRSSMNDMAPDWNASSNGDAFRSMLLR